MKTNKTGDPLDQKIDELLSTRPIKPSSDFTQRVLAATEAIDATAETSTSHSKRTTILRFALPIAAAIALAFTIVALLPEAQTPPATQVATSTTTSTPTDTSAGIEDSELQEIFLLEESLSKLAQSETDSLESEGLLEMLEALDSLYPEVET